MWVIDISVRHKKFSLRIYMTVPQYKSARSSLKGYGIANNNYFFYGKTEDHYSQTLVISTYKFVSFDAYFDENLS